MYISFYQMEITARKTVPSLPDLAVAVRDAKIWRCNCTTLPWNVTCKLPLYVLITNQGFSIADSRSAMVCEGTIGLVYELVLWIIEPHWQCTSYIDVTFSYNPFQFSLSAFSLNLPTSRSLYVTTW